MQEVGAGATAYSPMRWRRRAASDCRCELGASDATGCGLQRRRRWRELGGDQEVNCICASSTATTRPHFRRSSPPMATSHSHWWLLPISDAPGLVAPSTATASSGRGGRGWPSGEEQRRHRRLPLPTGAPHRHYTFTSPRHLTQSGDAPSTFNHTATAPEIFHLCILSFKVVHTNLLMSSCNLQIQAHDRLQGEDLHEPGITIRKYFSANASYLPVYK